MNGERRVVTETVELYGCGIPLYPKEFVHTKSEQNITEVLKCLADYKYYRMITETEYAKLVKQVENAESDDAVANIMTRLRHKIFN